MGTLSDLYKPSLALLTDLYQLTMAYGYWKLGRQDHEAVFHLYFRKHPFAGGFALACGLASVIDYLNGFRFDAVDLEYLASLTGNDNKPLFDHGFIDDLGRMQLSVEVDAIPEGTVVFANEPLVRVTGPIWQCQLLETPLLNLVNFQTLIATKAARVCLAARGEPVLEFGLRRAQGVDGSLAAARSAYVGGCAATSNVLAGRLYGIPVKGTHAHSWVMSFEDELESFEAYAQAMPNNCVFLVDTYDTLEGVRRAAEVGKQLRQKGHRMLGVRLDSGDLAYLSIEARKILDEAGLKEAQIVASNDLDEHLIESLKQQGATIAVWGVGTKLVTAYDQPALGGVYKLSAIRDGSNQPWHQVMVGEVGRIDIEDSAGEQEPGVHIIVWRWRSQPGRQNRQQHDQSAVHRHHPPWPLGPPDRIAPLPRLAIRQPQDHLLRHPPHLLPLSPAQLHARASLLQHRLRRFDICSQVPGDQHGRSESSGSAMPQGTMDVDRPVRQDDLPHHRSEGSIFGRHGVQHRQAHVLHLLPHGLLRRELRRQVHHQADRRRQFPPVGPPPQPQARCHLTARRPRLHPPTQMPQGPSRQEVRQQQHLRRQFHAPIATFAEHPRPQAPVTHAHDHEAQAQPQQNIAPPADLHPPPDQAQSHEDEADCVFHHLALFSPSGAITCSTDEDIARELCRSDSLGLPQFTVCRRRRCRCLHAG